MPEEFDAVFCVVGGKDNLSDATLAEMIFHLNGTIRTHTTGPINLTIDGYDDDPRSLWDIPEVRDYLKRLALRLDPAITDRLDETSRLICSVCLGFLREVGRNEATGNAIFERTN